MIHPNVFPTAIPVAPLVCVPLNATLVGVTMAVDTVSALEVVGLGTVIVLFVPFVFPPITRLKSTSSQRRIYLAQAIRVLLAL